MFNSMAGYYGRALIILSLILNSAQIRDFKNGSSSIEEVASILKSTLAPHFNIVLVPQNSEELKDYLLGEEALTTEHEVSIVSPADIQEVVKCFKFEGTKEYHERSLRSVIVVEAENYSQAEDHARKVAQFYGQREDGTTDRQLLFIMTMDEVLDEEEEPNFRFFLNGLARLFCLDSPVYFLARKQMSFLGVAPWTYMSVWEFYSVKNVTIVQEVDFYKRKKVWLPVGQRNNFHGAPIIATSVAADPAMNEPVASFVEVEGRLQFRKGFSVSILKDFAVSLNFSIVAERSWTYMSVISDGSLAGDGVHLLSGVADVSIYLSYITPERGGLLQPLVPVCLDRIQIFFRQPAANSMRNIFTLPFSVKLWTAVLVTWGTIAVTLLLVTFFLQDDDSLESSRSFGDVLFWMFHVICQKNSSNPPVQNSQRFVLLIALVATYVIYAAYCGSIISTIAVADVPIKSWKDVMNNGYTILAEQYTYYANYLKNQTNNTAYALELKQLYKSDDDSVKKIYTGKYAFLSTLDIVGPLSRAHGNTDQQFCSTISHLSLQNVVVFSGFYVTKGSPFKEPFNLRLLQLMEKGLISKYIQTLYRKTKPQCPKKAVSYQNLTLGDVFTAFIILLSGLLSSLLLLSLELLGRASTFGKFLPCWCLLSARKAAILIYVTHQQ